MWNRPNRWFDCCVRHPGPRVCLRSVASFPLTNDISCFMAGCDPVAIRLLTRNGHDWASWYPLIVEAVNNLRVRSVLIDGEVVCCDDRGLAVFQKLRRGQNEAVPSSALRPARGRCRYAPEPRSRCAKQLWPAFCAKHVTECALMSTSSTPDGLFRARLQDGSRGSCPSD